MRLFSNLVAGCVALTALAAADRAHAVPQLTVAVGSQTATFTITAGCDDCTLVQDNSKLGFILTGPPGDPVLDRSIQVEVDANFPIANTFLAITGPNGGTGTFLDVTNASLALSIPDATSGLLVPLSLNPPSNPEPFDQASLGAVYSFQADLVRITSVTGDLNVPVPEPASGAVFLAGIAALVARRRRGA